MSKKKTDIAVFVKTCHAHMDEVSATIHMAGCKYTCQIGLETITLDPTSRSDNGLGDPVIVTNERRCVITCYIDEVVFTPK